MSLLGTVDQILEESTLDHVRNNVAIEAPDVELCALVHAHSDPILHLDELDDELFVNFLRSRSLGIFGLFNQFDIES